jgi:hypothetical protein
MAMGDCALSAADGNQPRGQAVHGHDDHHLPLRLPCPDPPPRVAGERLQPGGAKGDPTLTRFPLTTASTALRMAGSALHRGGELEHGPLGPVQHENVRDMRTACRLTP